jgi:hypothetical protein
MKRVFVALIAGTVLSGFAAAYASTLPRTATNDGASPAQPAPAKTKASKLAASD